MCGIKSKACWLLLVVFLLSSLPLYSAEGLPDWVLELTEEELQAALIESVTLLEVTTNALENSIELGKRQGRLIEHQTNIIQNRDNSLIAIGSSFNEYVVQERQRRIRTGVGAVAAGLGVGVVIGVVMMVLGG